MPEDAPRARQLPLAEACKALGISRRTAQRRLAAGTLTGARVGQRWLIDVPLAESAAPESRQEGATAALLAELGTVRAQFVEASGECARLRGQVDTLTQRVAELVEDREHWRAAAAAALAVRALLAERVEVGRRWWQVWRR